MPFYSDKRSAGLCVVLGPKNSRRIAENTPPVSWDLRPCICQQLVRLATKDYSDRLLADIVDGVGGLLRRVTESAGHGLGVFSRPEKLCPS